MLNGRCWVTGGTNEFFSDDDVDEHNEYRKGDVESVRSTLASLGTKQTRLEMRRYKTLKILIFFVYIWALFTFDFDYI